MQPLLRNSESSNFRDNLFCSYFQESLSWSPTNLPDSRFCVRAAHFVIWSHFRFRILQNKEGNENLSYFKNYYFSNEVFSETTALVESFTSVHSGIQGLWELQLPNFVNFSMSWTLKKQRKGLLHIPYLSHYSTFIKFGGSKVLEKCWEKVFWKYER